MPNPLGKMKDLYQLKRRADVLKKRMERITVEVEERGVVIVMRGDQRVEQVLVDGEQDDRLKKAFNRAVGDSQKKVAKKLRGELSGLGLPGL